MSEVLNNLNAIKLADRGRPGTAWHIIEIQTTQANGQVDRFFLPASCAGMFLTFKGKEPVANKH